MLYDYICIGAGSGGIASANRAAMYGAQVALIESKDLGGTCVNVGCVPKKIMWYAAEIAQAIRYAEDYGFALEEAPGKKIPLAKRARLDWGRLVAARQAHIGRIHQSYQKSLAHNKVKIIRGHACFTQETVNNNDGDYKQIVVHTDTGEEELLTKKLLIATGGQPRLPRIPGAEYGINSDGFFALKQLPSSVAVVGAGYIAVELAGILCALGVPTNLFVRNEAPLRRFDAMLYDTLQEQMQASGITIHRQSVPKELVQETDGSLTLHLENGKSHNTQQVIWAIGRSPNTASLRPEFIGLACNPHGFISVDAYQNTNINGIYAIGDVIEGGIDLTPVAIRCGRLLSERLFNAKAHSETPKMDYEMVPTVIFSHPPIATIGINEEVARERYGEDLHVYTSSFTSMYTAITQHRESCCMKLLCVGVEQRVVGLHAIGYGVDEMLQGFSVAIKMGATKADFDRVVAIHPTGSEEFVIMH